MTVLTSFKFSASAVEAELLQNGAPELCSFSYLLGCDGAHSAFRATFLSLCDALLQPDGPSYWLMFVNREQMNPGPAFELLYRRVVERLITILSLPVGRLLRLRHDTAHVRLVTISVLGTIFIFQRAPSIALRALKWPDLKGERLVGLKEMLLFQVLEGITSPDQRGDPSTGLAAM